jgi:hypothetical protein
MKKIMIALIIIAASATAHGQYYVINKVLPNDLNGYSKTFIGITHDISTQVERKLSNFKKEMDVTQDSIYNEALINAYINQVKALEQSAINQFAVDDTIQVTKTGEEYYLPSDTVYSISYKRTQVKDRYDYLVAKYGESSVRGMGEFVRLKNEWDLYSDYLNQLSTQ